MSPAQRQDPQTDRDLTVKQQRAAQRASKLESFRQQQKRSARNRKIGLLVGIIGVVAIAALVIASVMLTPRPPRYTAGGEGETIEGTETFSNAANHVEGPVTYMQTPPAGGDHSPAWLNCGVYSEPVPNENAVHSLEHGAIWVTYDPELDPDDLRALRSKLPSTYVVLSPVKDLPAPIVLSGWNAQLQLDSATDERIGAFFEEYWKGGTAPEPGAPCTGGLDAPGKDV